MGNHVWVINKPQAGCAAVVLWFHAQYVQASSQILALCHYAHPCAAPETTHNAPKYQGQQGRREGRTAASHTRSVTEKGYCPQLPNPTEPQSRAEASRHHRLPQELRLLALAVCIATLVGNPALANVDTKDRFLASLFHLGRFSPAVRSRLRRRPAVFRRRQIHHVVVATHGEIQRPLAEVAAPLCLRTDGTSCVASSLKKNFRARLPRARALVLERFPK